MDSHDSVPVQAAILLRWASPVEWNRPVALISGSILLATLLVTIFVVRRIHLDPLSSFPGPFLARFSDLQYSRSYLGGRQPYDALALHARYGPVVRVAPNQLSFSSAQSWRDIYGPRKGHGAFIKSDFYDGGNFADQASSIVSERNPARHAEMRRFLSSAFSDRSLREQEHLVTGVVNDFVDQLGVRGAGPGGVDLSLWFNLLTFDIIGELAFGRSFDGVHTGTTNSWIATILESMRQASLADTLRRFPLLGKVYLKLNPQWLTNLLAGSIKHQNNVVELIDKRIHEKTDRKDFMSYLLQNRDEFNIKDIQLAAHASDFVIAGSETTATTLTTIVYYLCRNQDHLRKLQNEVRTAFKSYEEIDGISVAGLKFLHAVCLEALRIFPPLPLALPRVVPPGGDTVDGKFIPAGTIVGTDPFAASMSGQNFTDPWSFKPERWTGMNQKDQLEASQPFSIGTRACLGRGLAWLELRLTLCKMLFRYNIELVDNKVDWQRDVEMHLLWKKPALNVRMTPRV